MTDRLRDKNDKPVLLIAVDSDDNETTEEPTTGVKKVKLHQQMSAKDIKTMIEKAQSK